MSVRIDGTRTAILVAEGYPPQRLERTLEVLREHGGDVDIVSPGGDLVRANSGDHPSFAHTERSLEAAGSLLYDGILLLGEASSTEQLANRPRAIALLKTVSRQAKPVAVVGAGARLLARADVVRDRTVACAPSDTTAVTEAGGRVASTSVAQDEHLLTGRDGDALDELLDEFLNLLATRPEERTPTKPDW